MVSFTGNISSGNSTQYDEPFHRNQSMVEAEETVKLVISIFLIILMVISVVGNVCTCVIIIKYRSMKSPTNQYLLNLAVSDLVVSIFIPVEIYTMWVQDISLVGSYGLLLHFLLFEGLSDSSVLTILALTIERYLAISRPFSRHKSVLSPRISKIILIIWVVSFTFSFLNLYFIFKIHRKNYITWFTTLSCDAQRYFVGVTVTIFFVLPMTIIFVLFVLIVLKLRISRSVLRTNHLNNIQNKKRAIKMLAAVAASFFVCWAPFFALRVMLLLKDFSYEQYKYTWRVCIYISCINSYMSTAVNPVLYSLMSSRFRQAFKDLLGVRATNTPKPSKSNGKESIGQFSENIVQSNNL